MLCCLVGRIETGSKLAYIMPHKELIKYKDSALFMEVEGLKLAYWMNVWQENKPYLSFIHGFPSASWDWHNQWQALDKHYNLLAFDMLGFGLSDKPKVKYSLLAQADLQMRLWRHLRVKNSHIVAHDYGVSVAQELLSREYENTLLTNIDSILFLNGGLFSESHRPLFTQRLLASPLGVVIGQFVGKSKLKKSFQSIFGKSSQPSENDIDVLWSLLELNQGRRAMPKLLGYIKERAIYRNKWVEAMQNKQDKIGFVNGIQDPISGLHMLTQFKKLLPEAASLPIDVGHYPQIEAPEVVTEAINSFINSKVLAQASAP